MFFLTDENIDFELVEWLRANGHDVLDIKEAGLFRMPDWRILELAFDQKRVIISQDSDFGTLIFRDEKPFFGIIYLKPGHVEAQIHLQTLRSIFENGLNFSPPFICVAENKEDGTIKIRIRNF